MYQLKSVATSTASLEYFQGFPDRLNRPLGALFGSRRRVLTVAGLLSLPLAISAAATLIWPVATVEPRPQPFSGTWSCSLMGAPIGTLSVNGWNYVLGSGQIGEPATGTLVRVVYNEKYYPEVIRVPSGTLKEQFGVKLGYHYHVAGKPEQLVFNIAPGSGISCTRI